MTEKSKKYLSDILIAIDLIKSFTKDITDFHDYEVDKKTQSAVERQMAIIGEALNQLNKLEPDLNIKNSKAIIGFRNRLIHAYDSIDNSIIWAIIHRHLDDLRIEIQDISK
jgi:uncharacterized protein with HEPN domain